MMDTIEDAFVFESAEPEPELDSLAALGLTSKSKKKKKKKKEKDAGPIETEAPEVEAPIATDENLDGLAELGLHSKSKKKKKKKDAGPSTPSTENKTAEPQVPEPEAPTEGDELAELGLSTNSKKKKKKKKKSTATPADGADDDLDGLLAELDGGKTDKPAAVTPAEPEKPAEPADTGADELGDLMAELDGRGEKTSAAKKKKAKKKKKKAATEEPEIDEFEGLEDLLNNEKEAPVPAEKPVESSEPVVDELGDLMAELDVGGGGGQSAANKKKKDKKKKKKAAVKENKEAEGGADASSASVPTTKKKKESAIVRKAREQQEKLAAAAEAERLAREAEEARVAEEERLEREAEEKLEAARAKKKAAEKARKERRRAEGTLLNKAQKAQRKKAEAFKAQLRAQGLLPTGEAPPPGPSKKHVPKRQQKPAPEKVEPVEKKEEPEIVETPPPTVEEEKEEVLESWDKMEVEEKKVGEPEESSEEEESSSDDSDDYKVSKAEKEAEKRREAVEREHAERRKANIEARTPDRLRSPVICIMGHVDTGKTKILDKIRRTSVQDAEAGGITQQIGATFFPIDAVKKETMKLDEGPNLKYNFPSLLIIDTPGHESFANLRSRGSGLCDIAILVMDIMHPMEPQTRESIQMLKNRKTPFVVALNKIDRLYDWEAQPGNCPTRKSLNKQKAHVRTEFQQRLNETKVALMEEGFNSDLYWENQDPRRNISLVPTSAITGEGIPDLLMLLLTLPQQLLVDRLMFCANLEATVLEVKTIDGLGTTIDIILTGGKIHAGDTILVVGLDGPIQTTIRSLLTPHPMKEMRVKGQYQRHSSIEAAQGIKIAAEGLEKAVAGTQLIVVKDPDNEYEVEYARGEVMDDYDSIISSVKKNQLGVYVQASTLGSLEALLAFLKTSKIPVAGINIGPVHKRDVMVASTMLEKNKNPDFAIILAFDVKVEAEAKETAEEMGVTIFTAEIIYHLFDAFEKHMEEAKTRRREESEDAVVFPSVCEILPQHVICTKNPIILGVKVTDGILRIGTPIVIQTPEGTWLDIGKVQDIHKAQASVKTAKRSESVSVKIGGGKTENIMYGRHFDAKNLLYSKISRKSIDTLKEHFREDLDMQDWNLVRTLKTKFKIQ